MSITDDMTERLRAEIRNCGLSLCELARRSGVTQPALGRFLSGKRGLMIASVAKLFPALTLAVVSTGPVEPCRKKTGARDIPRRHVLTREPHLTPLHY